MDFNELRQITNETDKVNALYDIFNEAMRLESKAGQVEFLTSVHAIKQVLKPGMRILDLGAGTGRYSLYFANLGYKVTAIELTKKHAQLINTSKTNERDLTVICGNAVEEMKQLKNETYDIILCFGPLYHLEQEKDRVECIQQMKRVLTKEGTMFFAFINNDFVFATETQYECNYLESSDYEHDTFLLHNFPFIFYTPNSARALLHNCNITITNEIAQDGLSELLADKINDMSEAAYSQWLNYHLYISQKPEFFGASNHLLFVGKKENGEG